jgi:uncharacterized protein YrrD
MDVSLGSHVTTKDNQDLGAIDRLILDTATGQVRAVIVRKGVLLHEDVEIPLEKLSIAPDSTLRVPYTTDQVRDLPEFQPASYTAAPPNYVPSSDYPPATPYWPIGSGGVQAPPVAQGPAPGTGRNVVSGEVFDEVTAAQRRQDLDNAVIAEGSDVIGRDGKKLGEAHQLFFDIESGLLTHFIVRKGFLVGKDHDLPASLIASVDDGVLYLKSDLDDLQGNGTR